MPVFGDGFEALRFGVAEFVRAFGQNFVLADRLLDFPFDGFFGVDLDPLAFASGIDTGHSGLAVQYDDFIVPPPDAGILGLTYNLSHRKCMKYDLFFKLKNARKSRLGAIALRRFRERTRVCHRVVNKKSATGNKTRPTLAPQMYVKSKPPSHHQATRPAALRAINPPHIRRRLPWLVAVIT